MQATKPRPTLTFTYRPPRKGRIRGTVSCWSSIPPPIWAPMRCAMARRALGQTGRAFSMSMPSTVETTWRWRPTAWTRATSTTDPSIEQFVRELFQVVFSDSKAYRLDVGKHHRI